MQRHVQQSALGVGVHGKIERRRRLHDVVDDALDPAGCLFGDQDVVRAEEGHRGRLVELKSNLGHDEIRIDHRGRDGWKLCGGE